MVCLVHVKVLCVRASDGVCSVFQVSGTGYRQPARHSTTSPLKRGLHIYIYTSPSGLIPDVVQWLKLSLGDSVWGTA